MAPGNFRGHFFAIYARNSIASWWTNFVRTHCAPPDGADPQRSSRFPTPVVGYVLPSLQDSPNTIAAQPRKHRREKPMFVGFARTNYESQVTNYEAPFGCRSDLRASESPVTSHYSPVTSPYDADDRAYRDRSCG